MRGKIIKPWDCPPSNPSIQKVVKITDMDKPTPWSELAPIIEKNYTIKFGHTFGKNALIEFDTHNTAVRFVSEFKIHQLGSYATVSFSPIPSLEIPDYNPAHQSASRVICLQILRLQVSLGIYDIYDECSNFGTVEKIICFEKNGKFALVQMHDVKEAALALANLSNSNRYFPNFQIKIQYSHNQDIIIQFNNAKSFDFTHPGAIAQFDQLRHTSSSESAFFTPDHSDQIKEVFDFWRPVPVDQIFTQSIKIAGIEMDKSSLDGLFNLISQYGPARFIKLVCMPKQKYAVVTMASSFYAKLVIAHLQNCPYNNNTNKLVFYHPHFAESAAENDHTIASKDFSDEAEDLDISDYQNMWPPSDIVWSSKNISQMPIPKKAIPIKEKNVFKFPTVQEAVQYIMKRPDVPSDALLRFSRL